VFGVLRGKYLTPAFAIKIGENAIRNCFSHQLKAIREEGTECIPYDMDDKYAYRTGNYSSQIAALDANHFALEDSLANGFTLWTYVATVCIHFHNVQQLLTTPEQPLLGRPMEWRGPLHLLSRR
jgi:hypothetical protein